jgi:PAS domain S-box-containing protein
MIDPKAPKDAAFERSLERDAQHFAAIVESSDDAIVSKNLESTVLTWNPAAVAMFGFEADEIIGRSIRILIPDDRQDEEDEVLSKIRSGLRVQHYETVRRRKDGSLIQVSLTVSPIRDGQGVIVGASKIARDITELRRAERERQRLLTIARDASRLKDEFLATLSHELRTPLHAMFGYLRLMQTGLLPPDKMAEAVDVVVRNTKSLTQIVEDVLDVSRIISGKLRLNVQPVELGPIITDAVGTVQPAADAKGIRITTDIDPHAGPVSGDPDRLRQILWNLCSNAVKFTERGGRIRVCLERSDDSVSVVVSDTGMGIAPEFLPHLFERFRQADSSIERAHGGLGLGLAICRHLTELQGGRISATSDGTGHGATFRVELPQPHAEPIQEPEARGVRQFSASSNTLSVPLLSGVRFLVVDDDRDALALVREVLEATGATVVTADSGGEALRILENTLTDALIADLGMPGMSGFELLERIRRSDNPQVRSIPAAALTAFARPDDRARSQQHGFEQHLVKPIDPDQLMAAAAKLARRAP